MPLTQEQLCALPEFQEYKYELQPDGITVKTRITPKFCTYDLKNDDVLMFSDESGSWAVDYHFEGGPYKRRCWL